MSAGTLTVKVVGDTNDFERSMGSVGKGAAVAFAAVAAFAVAGAVKGIAAFTQFQGSMNEVFTLLPGISDDAMSKMTGQVKNFSREFGVLPDEVVPALYQALSAGVPQDNVFEFLETAQKAAKGGVSDLTTAVDGISSVVNAYGSDVIDATKASDLMFTAVRLGKTNFSELSASLSNVTPIASALGVKFEDVAAGLATMTAKGVPTAQATTQMRSLFVDLSKAGGKTAKVFEDMAGVSFQEFIAAGGNTSDALGIMQKAADESGVELQDLFGSVEAGSAALLLAGGEEYAANIDAMGNSAGATQAAFDQMMTGLGPIFDKLKAGFAVLMIEVGERLAPIVESALARVGVAFGLLSAWWTANLPTITAGVESIRTAFTNVAEVVGPIIGTIVSFLGDNLIPVFAGLGVVMGTVVLAAVYSLTAAFIALFSPFVLIVGGLALVTAAVVYAYKEFDGFRAVIDAVAQFLTGTVWPAIKSFADLISAAFAALVGFVQQHWSAIQQTISTVVDAVVAKFAALVGFVRQHWAAIQEAISHVINVVQGIIRTAVDVISALWRAWGDDLVRIVKTAWDFIFKTVENAIRLVSSIIQTVLAVINGDWGRAWDGIKGILSAVWDQIKNVVSTAFEVVKSLIGGGLSTIREVWAGAWDAVKGKLSEAWDGIKSGVSSGVTDIMITVGGIPGKILAAIGNLSSLLFGAGKAVVQGLIDGAKSAFGAVRDTFNNLTSMIPDWKGPLDKDKKLLVPAGHAIMGGLIRSIDADRSALRSKLGEVTNDINVGGSVSTALGVPAAGSAGLGDPDAFAMRMADVLAPLLMQKMRQA